MSKGSQQRPRRIPSDEYDSAWDRVFGKKKPADDKPVETPVEPTTK